MAVLSCADAPPVVKWWWWWWLVMVRGDGAVPWRARGCRPRQVGCWWRASAWRDACAGRRGRARGCAASIDARVGRGARSVRRLLPPSSRSELRKVLPWRTPGLPFAACSTPVSVRPAPASLRRLTLPIATNPLTRSLLFQMPGSTPRGCTPKVSGRRGRGQKYA